MFYTLKMANPLAKRKTTDWTCFCQLKSSEILKHPYQKSCYHRAYTSIQNYFIKFIENDIPFPFDMTRDCLITEDWNSISKSLLNNKAVYHKTCRDKIRPHIVNRILNKRRCEDSDSHGTSSSPRKTRKSVGCAGDSTDKSQCVYCSIPQTGNSEPLCKAMTDNVSENLKQMAKDAEI